MSLVGFDPRPQGCEIQTLPLNLVLFGLEVVTWALVSNMVQPYISYSEFWQFPKCSYIFDPSRNVQFSVSLLECRVTDMSKNKNEESV